KIRLLGIRFKLWSRKRTGEKRFTEVASRISRYSQLLKLFAVIKIREGLSKWQN
ncbi:indole-3-glycerol phosphate synthase family protein, partial [Vibrio parahaemolyticus EKP-028]